MEGQVKAPKFFATAAAFGAWLAKHGAQERELLVGYHKVASGKPCMTWSESVDEALCHGWIDAVRRRIDEHRYSIRFTHRKPGSIWSNINIAKARKLIAEGRMQPPGLAAWEHRSEKKSGVYSFENEPKELPPADIRTFKRNKVAWKYWETCPPGYRKQMIHRVVTAKQAETHERRLGTLIAACAEGRRL